uniref:hypothetical protein n=1 Tax=Amycolatopsis sp. cmx-11-12 TaxID=2785795 RepID=UPI003917DC08
TLKNLFQTQTKTEKFNISKTFLKYKLTENAAVKPHIIKIINYTQRLKKLNFPINKKLTTDFILSSLPPNYKNFISNYHIHKTEKNLNKLYNILKTTETDIKKNTDNSHITAIQNKPSFKKKNNS